MNSSLLGSMLLLLTACSGSPTELIVVVESNLDVPDEIDEVEVVVTGPSAISMSTTEMLVGTTDFPLTLTVVPAAETLGPVSIEARGLRGGELQIRAEVRTTLVEGESKMVRLFLIRSCLDRACDGMTCGEVGCMPIDVDGDALADWTGAPPPFDGTQPCVANGWDQDDDGQGDVMCGGTDCDDLEVLAFDGAVEECDGIDNDCDGMADEDCDCTPEGAVEDCPTSCGSTGSHTCSAGVWTTCAADEVCNGTDVDCDGITDEGFTYAAGTPQQITMSAVDSRSPDMVFANGRFNVTWEDSDDRTDEDDPEDIFFIALEEDGSPMGRVPSMVARDARDPKLAASEAGFGLTWWDPDSCGTSCTAEKIFFATLDELGALITGPTEIEGNAGSDPGPVVAWTGSEFGVAYYDSRVYVQSVSAAGAGIGGRLRTDDWGTGGLDLLHTGAAFALLNTADAELRFSEGTPAAFGVSVTPHTSGGGSLNSPVFVEIDGGYLAAWRVAGRIESAVLDASGNLVGMVREHRLPGMRTGGVGAPALATSAGQHILVFPGGGFGNADILFVRFAPDGSPLQPITEVTLPGQQDDVTAAWGTDRLGVVYVDDTGLGNQLHFNAIACE